MAIDVEEIKAKLKAYAHEGKERALDFVDDFKRQSKFFKMRVGVVAIFIGIAFLTLIVAPAPGEKNPIDAEIWVSQIEWGEKNKTIIEVSNKSGDDYKPFRLEVVCTGVGGGTFAVVRDKVLEGRTEQFEAKHLSDKGGGHPPSDFVPATVEVRVGKDDIYPTLCPPATTLKKQKCTSRK